MRIKIKGPKEGYCAICQQYCRLTYDHVPPKGCVTISPMEMRTLIQELCPDSSKHIIFQNGVKFRTLCSECNNGRLGSNYDIELKRFSNEVSRFLKAIIDSDLHFPFEQTFAINTQKIVRAIVGHTLAAFLPEDISKPTENAPFYDSLRSYFLDETLPIPSKLKILYWPYPANNQVHIRAFSVQSIKWKGNILGDLLKFFPIAYWLIWDMPDNIISPVQELSKIKDLPIENSTTIKINFQKVPRHDWPETPNSTDYILLSGQNSSISKIKPSRLD